MLIKASRQDATVSEIWREPSGKRRFFSLKDILWLIYLYPLRLLATICPLRLIASLGRLLSPLFRISRKRFHRLALQRMTAAPGLNPRRSPSESARLFMERAVTRALEDLIMHRLERNRALTCISLQGEEHLRRARAAGKGALLVSGHFYANRLAKRYLSLIGYPVLSVRNRHPQDFAAGRLGRAWVQRRYIEFLHSVIRDEVMLQDPGCSLKMLRRLRQGGLVDLHLDAPLSDATAYYPFLGTSRRFPTGFLKIARLADCVIIPMLCLGDSGGLTIVVEEPVYDPSRDQGRSHQSDLMPLLVSRLERQILEYPDQWELWVRM